jgi:TATA-box binding protein (TBP) (component of TFIID and TFIIIB)
MYPPTQATMRSVCYLTRPHAEVQAEHLAASQRYMRELLLFDDDTTKTLDMRFRPTEGLVDPTHPDPWGLKTAYHDVIPNECLSPDLRPLYRNGSDYNAAQIRDKLLRVMEEKGLKPDRSPPHEGFVMNLDNDPAHDMQVDVVNVVNTSYWWLDRYGNNNTQIILGHRFMFRRLSHMGCQINHVRTSAKICFAWPLNATKLISHPGRVLETGSNNHLTASLTFNHATLPAFQYAGMPHLHVSDRTLRNVVTTTNLPIPPGGSLLLPLLYHKMAQHMRATYEPSLFAGVIVHHPEMDNVRALIFNQGAIVVVGTTSIQEATAALRLLVPLIMQATSTPENCAELERLGPEIQKLRNVKQQVFSLKRTADSQTPPPGAVKKPRLK